MKCTFCCSSCFLHPEGFFFYFSIRINCSSFLPVRHLLSQIASVQLEEDLENEPVKTNDPGCSQLARGKRKAVPDRQRPSLHLCFLCLTLLPTSLWDCETVTSRLQWHGEGEGAGTPLSSSIQCVWPPTYHCPNTRPCPHPLFISQGKKDWHIYALLPVSQLLEFEFVGVLRGGMSVCRNNLFLFSWYFFSLFHKKSKQGKKRKLNVVEMFQNHPGVRCCSTLICYLLLC